MDNDLIKIIITGVVSPAIALLSKYYLEKHSAKNKINDECISILDHPFFERMKCLRSHIQYTFELTNKGKQEVFKDILLHKISYSLEQYNIFVQEVDRRKNELSNEELYNIILDALRRETELHSKYYLSENYSDSEKQCLSIVMTKFNKWHSPKLENIFQSVQIICFSKFYKDIITKTSVVLDVLLNNFIDTLNDAELTLNELNGDLKGLTFKNIKL